MRPVAVIASIVALGSYACVGDDTGPPSSLTGYDGGAPEAAAGRDADRPADDSGPPVDASLDAPADGSADAADAADATDAAVPSGVLDTSFNATGIVTRVGTNGGKLELVGGVALDSLGRVLVAGASTGTGGTKAAVWRFTSAGAADATFGTGGVWLKNQTFVASQYDSASAIEVDAQDRPVVTGQSNNTVPIYMATWRLTIAGALDTSLASTGFYGATNSAGPGGYDWGQALAIDGAGNIDVAGASKSTATGIDLCVWRHSSAGVPDTSGFGTPNGFTTESGAASQTANPFDAANKLVIDANGKLVMVGGSYTGTTTKALVVRATSAGVIDTSFHATGLLLLASVAGGTGAGAYDSASGLALDSTGRLIVGGTSRDGTGNYRAFVTRLTAVGDVDNTFGTNGLTVLPSPGGAAFAFASALARDSKGRIIMTGSSGNAIAVWRLTAAGQLDATFGSGGFFTITNSAGYAVPDGGVLPQDSATGLRIDSADRPVIAGTSFNGTDTSSLIVLRLTP